MVGLKPDAVLMLADTNPCLSVIGAKRLLIPIFQMETGNRCQDACLPEETKASTVHEKLHMGKGQYILLPSHWEKNIYIEMNCLRLFTIINRIAVRYDTPILYSTTKAANGWRPNSQTTDQTLQELQNMIEQSKASNPMERRWS